MSHAWLRVEHGGFRQGSSNDKNAANLLCDITMFVLPFPETFEFNNIDISRPSAALAAAKVQAEMAALAAVGAEVQAEMEDPRDSEEAGPGGSSMDHLTKAAFRGDPPAAVGALTPPVHPLLRHPEDLAPPPGAPGGSAAAGGYTAPEVPAQYQPPARPLPSQPSGAHAAVGAPPDPPYKYPPKKRPNAAPQHKTPPSVQARDKAVPPEKAPPVDVILRAAQHKPFAMLEPAKVPMKVPPVQALPVATAPPMEGPAVPGFHPYMQIMMQPPPEFFPQPVHQEVAVGTQQEAPFFDVFPPRGFSTTSAPRSFC